ncbi:putative Diheme cytochrome c-type [Gammaproteobacteria bacterium]
MKSNTLISLFLLYVRVGLWTLLSGLLWISSSFADGDLVQQGQYIFRLAGCQGCHTDTKHKGAVLAGGRALVTPFGTFYPPNLTSDPKFGLGNWSEDDFIRALKNGVSPSGKSYFPVFPYTSYTHMSREDMHALWAYLRTVPAVVQPNRDHDLPWYLGRLASWGWQFLFFTPDLVGMPSSPATAVNRGAYIATALAHCEECHTPRNIFGVLNHRMAYAGTKDGPEGTSVPSITKDTKNRISKWSHSDLVDFFTEGALPDGDYVGGLMAEVVDNGLKHLTKEDAKALATYILLFQSAPPAWGAILSVPPTQTK